MSSPGNSKYVCGFSHCNYAVPPNYNPQYGLPDERNDRILKGADLAETIFKNCLVLGFKESFYTGTDKVLKGYSWFNFPGRVFLWIRNWWSNGKIYADTAIKIEETFEFILGIRKNAFDFNDGEAALRTTHFTYSLKFYYPYTTLAKKIIKTYPPETYQKLNLLAHRVLHERPMWIQVNRNGSWCNRQNIAKEAIGTPYAHTTVWDDN